MKITTTRIINYVNIKMGEDEAHSIYDYINNIEIEEYPRLRVVCDLMSQLETEVGCGEEE